MYALAPSSLHDITYQNCSHPLTKPIPRKILYRIATLATEACLLAQSLPPPERALIVGIWASALETALRGVQHAS